MPCRNHYDVFRPTGLPSKPQTMLEVLILLVPVQAELVVFVLSSSSSLPPNSEDRIPVKFGVKPAAAWVTAWSEAFELALVPAAVQYLSCAIL
eukprot:5806397-Pyramimonas_sp.AAC.1